MGPILSIDFIIAELQKDPEDIIENIKKKLTPGAKDSRLTPTPIREPSFIPSRVNLIILYLKICNCQI